MEQPSSFVQHQPYQLYLAALRIPPLLASPKRWRRGCRNTKKKTGLWQNQSLWRWTCHSTVSASSSSAKDPIASRRPRETHSFYREILTPRSKKKFKTRRSVGFSSEGCKMHTLAGWWMNVAGEPCRDRWKSGIMGIFWIWIMHGAILKTEVTANLVASRNSENSGNPKAGNRKWPRHFHMSSAVVLHMEKVFSIVRQIYGRSPTDDFHHLDVNTAIWSIFLNTTLQAAIHLGRDYAENLRFIENHLWKSVKQLFEETEKLIKNQTEISGVWPRLITKSTHGKMISGPFQAILFTVITCNPESNCSCREKHHFLFRWNVSMLPEILIHHWMQCWRKTLMITETWMEIVNCQIRGPDSQDLLHWKRNRQMGFRGLGGDWREDKRPPGQTLCGHRFGKICPMRRKTKKSKSGLLGNLSSTVPKDCVLFIWLILMTRNSRISWKMRLESGKFRCQPQCLAKIQYVKAARKHPHYWKNTRQNMLVLLKLTNLWRYAWKEFLTGIMKITWQQKGWIH